MVYRSEQTPSLRTIKALSLSALSTHAASPGLDERANVQTPEDGSYRQTLFDRLCAARAESPGGSMGRHLSGGGRNSGAGIARAAPGPPAAHVRHALRALSFVLTLH